MARILRICLGVPRASASALVTAESRQPTFHARKPSSLFFVWQHNTPIIHYAKTFKVEPLHAYMMKYGGEKNLLPASEYWPACATHPPWRLAIPEIVASIPGVGRKYDMPVVAIKQFITSLY